MKGEEGLGKKTYAKGLGRILHEDREATKGREE